ncbi:helix-turn-helix transcriptional regulator [Streptococcus uberis]|uniref:helix-turn-helix domain-containing protein n=1 Tax=Streptococcus uberis TaxID=1349 RepID=UPI0033657174
MFSTFERIKELCSKNGISLNTLEEKLNFSTNYIYSMKRGNPKTENLEKIADYFNVSTDYLLGRTDNPKIAPSTDKEEVIDFKDALNMTAAYNGKPLSQDAKDLLESMLKQMTKD